MTPLETAAKAAYEADTSRQYVDEYWNTLHPEDRKRRIAEFGAGLATLMEPTPEMVDAACTTFASAEKGHGTLMITGQWQAMLTKILEE